MKILFSNFFSYDWIIFAMAVVNAVIFFLAWKKARALYESVAPRINISSGNAEAAIAQAQENSTYFSLYEKWQKAEFFYTLFCNLTGVFTLLGILGTVISLLHLVDSSADLTGEFMGALTSTLWGIIFTIIFYWGSCRQITLPRSSVKGGQNTDPGRLPACSALADSVVSYSVAMVLSCWTILVISC